MTVTAIIFIALEFHEQAVADFCLFALQPHGVAGGADAGFVLEIDLEFI